MNKKRKRLNLRQIIATSIGVLMVIALFASLAIGFGDNNETVSPEDLEVDVDITRDPRLDSFPAPIANVAISRHVVHKTGMFQVPLLEGWAIFQQPLPQVDGSTIYEDSNSYDPNRSRADIIMNSAERLSIAQVYMLVGVSYETTQALSDNLFTESYFFTEWSTEYESWEITNRTVGEVFVTIDFELYDEGLMYFGRQISWQNLGHVFNLRFVVPSNNPQLLANLQKTYIEKFVFYSHMPTTPLADWVTYDDPTMRTLIKLPDYWEKLSGSEGRPTTYGDAFDTNSQVTVQQIADTTITSLEEAEAWLMTYRESASIFEGQPVNLLFGSGYWLSYTYPNADGDRVSAIMAMLDNGTGGLNIAEIRVTGYDGNLLVLTNEQPTLARTIIETFAVMAPADYVYISQE